MTCIIKSTLFSERLANWASWRSNLIKSLSALLIFYIKHIQHTEAEENGRHFADDTFRCIWVSNKASLKYVTYGRIDKMSAQVQIMAWRRTGAKPLSDPMMTQSTDAYMRQQAWMCYMYMILVKSGNPSTSSWSFPVAWRQICTISKHQSLHRNRERSRGR